MYKRQLSGDRTCTVLSWLIIPAILVAGVSGCSSHRGTARTTTTVTVTRTTGAVETASAAAMAPSSATSSTSTASSSVPTSVPTSTTTTTPPQTTTDPPTTTASPVIDRIDGTSWAYNRVGSDSYVADDNNSKNIEIFWKAFAGQQLVRQDCFSTVRLTGPGLDKSRQTEACDADNPGLFFHVGAPGRYTATVVVNHAGQAPMTATHEITLIPYGSTN